jgi:hypothetical protein
MIKINNKGLFTRSQWCTVTAHPQRIPDGQLALVDDHGNVIAPAYAGQKHSDNVQNVHVLCKDLEPGYILEGTLASMGPADGQPVTPSDWVADDYLSVLPELTMRCYKDGVLVDIVNEPWDLAKGSVLEQNGAVIAFKLYTTIKGPDCTLHVNFYPRLYTGQDVVPFELSITNSDQTSPKMEQKFQAITIAFKDYPVFPFGKSRGMTDPIQVGNKYIAGIAAYSSIGDGQTIPVVGSLLMLPSMDQLSSYNTLDQLINLNKRILNLMAEFTGPLLGISDWRGRFGPSKKTAGAIRPLQEVLNQHEIFLARLQEQGYWTDSVPLGMSKSPGQTGGQQDFGVTKGSQAVDLMCPEYAREMLYSALAECLRPIHHRNPDGSIVANANYHENGLVFLNGRVHWHNGVSPNRLGKPWPQPEFTTHGWMGKDNQHWSSNILNAAFALTGSNLLKECLQAELECLLGEMTTVPGLSTNDPDAARAMGRCSDTLLWLHFNLGDDRIPAKLVDRMNICIMPKLGSDPLLQGDFFMLDHTKDDRLFGGAKEAVSAWNCALGVEGLWRVGQYFGFEQYTNLALKCARSIIKYCLTPIGGQLTFWEIVAFKPEGLAPGDYDLVGNDPNGMVWRTGWFTDWMLGVCFQYSQSEGKPWVEPELLAKARLMLATSPTTNDWASAEWLAY